MSSKYRRKMFRNNRTWEWGPLKPHCRQWKDETNQQNYGHV